MADVAGYFIDGCMYSHTGELLFPGSLKAKAAIRQIEPNGPPVEVLDFNAETHWKGETVKWSFTMTREQFNDLAANLPKFLPEGVDVVYKGGMLADAIAAFSESPEHFPVKKSAEWADGTGLYYYGRQVANFHAEVTEERTDPRTGETFYKVRSKQPDGTFRYVDGITFDQLQMGGWEHRIGAAARTFHGVLQGMVLTTLWQQTTPTQRKQFALDELRQQRRDIDSRISKLEGWQ